MPLVERIAVAGKPDRPAAVLLEKIVHPRFRHRRLLGFVHRLPPIYRETDRMILIWHGDAYMTRPRSDARLFAAAERLPKSLRDRDVRRGSTAIHHFFYITVDLPHVDYMDPGFCRKVPVVKHRGR